MKTLNRSIELTGPQSAFHLSEARFRALVGGIGSGKSFAGALDLIIRAKSRRLYMATAPTYRLLADSSLRTFLDLARGLDWLRGFSKSSVTATLGNRAEVLFRSTDEPERLRGSNLSGVWMDEASLSEEAALDILLGRLREKGEHGWLSLSFTPRGRLHWTYRRFGRADSGAAVFNSRTDQNPNLPPGFAEELRAQYTAAQAEQELGGAFVDLSGSMFQRHWFKTADAAPQSLRRVRFWDLASSSPRPGTDPDYTAGVLLGRDQRGCYWVLDVARVRTTPAQVEALVASTAVRDGHGVPIRMEEEPGSSGKTVISHYLRNVLPGYDFAGVKSSGDKATRARPLAAQAEAGNVTLVQGPWNKDFLDELEVFPSTAHDDMTDASSGALNHLAPVFIGTFDPGPARAVNPIRTMPGGVFRN